MLRHVTRCPKDTVFGVELGGQHLTCQWAVEAFLEAPSRLFAHSIEPGLEMAVTKHIVDGAKAVIGTPQTVVHHRMASIALPRCRGDLEEPVTSNRADELAGVGIRLYTHRKKDPDWPLRLGDQLEEVVALPGQHGIRALDQSTTQSWGVPVGFGDLGGRDRVEFDCQVDNRHANAPSLSETTEHREWRRIPLWRRHPATGTGVLAGCIGSPRRWTCQDDNNEDEPTHK